MADSNICRSSRKGFGIFLGEKKAVEKVNDLRNVLVEQEGVEPSSKQGARWLSTCVSVYWFSTTIWKTESCMSAYTVEFRTLRPVKLTSYLSFG